MTSVSSFSELNAAIDAIDGGASGSYTITITQDFQDSAAIHALTNAGATVTIVSSASNHWTIDAHGFSGMFVYAGTVTLQNLTIANARALGGAGTGGGGGGAGLGGGLFVASGAHVTLSSVTFTGDRATGGAGGSGANLGLEAGGGGGLGGAGGQGTSAGGGGGGGGIGPAASGGAPGVAGGPGILVGVSAGAGGGGSGASPSGGGGGGGVGGSPGLTHGDGGGGFGGGGGGTSNGNGGTGGFGGGGGGASFGAASGKGGWGGGGGGSSAAGALGGFGAGNGAGVTGGGGGGAGGGGLGAGGDIFVQQGGTLVLEGGSLSGGAVTGGTGANAGSAFGSGIFLQGNQTITFAPLTATTLTISDKIADEAGSGGTGAGTLHINGAGTVSLSGSNSFTGGITFDAGTLILGATGAAGSGTITFGSTADETLAYTTAFDPSNTIAGLSSHARFDITDLSAAGLTATLDLASDLLSLKNGATTVYSKTVTGSYTNLFAHAASDGASGTFITFDTIPCFLRGTMILTPSGEIPVEDLREGDRVKTLSGATHPITWVGSGRTLVTPRNRCDVAPVIVRRNALADGMPARDLHVTRHHAILVQDVLVPVEHLVNDISVVWDNRPQVIEYYHLELDAHDILLADGAPAESFRDDNSAQLFQNIATRRPDLQPLPPCAPVINDGPALEAAWIHVAARAATLTGEPWTDDADLHLMVDNHRVDPQRIDGDRVIFALPDAAQNIAIASRATIPAASGDSADLRRLGVAVAGIALLHGDARTQIAIDDPRLRDGFTREHDNHRWTKGLARLPDGLTDGKAGPLRLELRVVASLRYRRPIAPVARADTDPDLHLLVAGRRIDPVTHAGGVFRFRLTPNCGDVMIVSRAVVPFAAGLGPDRRRLGVALTGLKLRGPGIARMIPLDDAALDRGLYAPEGDHCWTDGVARISAKLIPQDATGLELQITIANVISYTATETQDAARRTA